MGTHTDEMNVGQALDAIADVLEGGWCRGARHVRYSPDPGSETFEHRMCFYGALEQVHGLEEYNLSYESLGDYPEAQYLASELGARSVPNLTVWNDYEDWQDDLPSVMRRDPAPLIQKIRDAAKKWWSEQ